MTAPVLINGQWRAAKKTGEFQAENPSTKEPLADVFPISSWQDCDEALAAAQAAFAELRTIPAERIAAFLELFADRIEARKEEIVAAAHAETALPVSPRLADAELPRTTGQLRQAAAAVREGSWKMPTIDSAANIRSCLGPIGPVWVFGPNNFPLAFGSVSGGDFAAAIAAGNPVIGKANSSHPKTTQLFAEEALLALKESQLPPATVQLIYRTDHATGEKLVADPRTGATGYTGSRSAGLKLKAAADAAGKPIYLELSSINPVVILPGALRERGDEIAAEFTGSCLMGSGQFCTNPGLVVLLKGAESEKLVADIAQAMDSAPAGTLLSGRVASSLRESLEKLEQAGASRQTKSKEGGPGYSHANTLLSVSGDVFLEKPAVFQEEAFGNASLVVTARDVDQAAAIVDSLEGNLTGAIYSHSGEDDGAACDRLSFHLRPKVGRLLNDKMPTGVAVSPAMNHGGPFPATGHPGFTAVGIPASLIRFAQLECYDNVRPQRLPQCLQNSHPGNGMWRRIDGQWSQQNVEK